MIDVNKLVNSEENLQFKEVVAGALLGKFAEGINPEHASFQLLLLSENAAVPEHGHPDKEEFQYVVSGKGEVSIAGQKMPVKAGSMIFIPADIRHSIRNTEKEEMKVMEVYAK